MIAEGLFPYNAEKHSLEASKLFIKELKSNINKKRNFAFETTLSGKMYQKIVEGLLEQGWDVTIYYLWIPSIEFSIQRVKERVLQGGHNIPKEALIRRYNRSLHNLMQIYVTLSCSVFCLDNTQNIPDLVFQSKNGKIKINNKSIMQKIKNETKKNN
jgi:predicted ABC-type ATPase